MQTPSTKVDIEQHIEQSFDALSPELQRAARWVQQHGAALALHSMRSSARQAGVTPATMTRLAQRLGFDGFEGLRQPFAQRLAHGQPMFHRDPAVPMPVLDTLAQTQMGHIAAMAAMNTSVALDKAADALLKARHVAILGLRMSYGVAFQLHYGYGLLAANGLLLSDTAGTLQDQILQLGKDDLLVALSQSPYSRTTVDAVQQAHRQGVPVLALTDSALSPIGRAATLRLLFASSANTFLHSMTGTLALVEALLDAVTRRGGRDVAARLAQRRRELADARAYWELPGRKLPSRPTERKAIS